jgi:hypothetical protein
VSWYCKALPLLSFPLHFLRLMTDRILRDARISARLALGAMRLLSAPSDVPPAETRTLNSTLTDLKTLRMTFEPDKAVLILFVGSITAKPPEPAIAARVGARDEDLTPVGVWARRGRVGDDSVADAACSSPSRRESSRRKLCQASSSRRRSSPPPDPPSSRSAVAPACRPAGGRSERLRRHADCAP